MYSLAAALSLAGLAAHEAIGIVLAAYFNDVLWSTPALYAWTVVAVVGGVGVWMETRADRSWAQGMNWAQYKRESPKSAGGGT